MNGWHLKAVAVIGVATATALGVKMGDYWGVLLIIAVWTMWGELRWQDAYKKACRKSYSDIEDTIIEIRKDYLMVDFINDASKRSAIRAIDSCLARVMAQYPEFGDERDAA